MITIESQPEPTTFPTSESAVEAELGTNSKVETIESTAKLQIPTALSLYSYFCGALIFGTDAALYLGIWSADDDTVFLASYLGGFLGVLWVVLLGVFNYKIGNGNEAARELSRQLMFWGGRRQAILYLGIVAMGIFPYLRLARKYFG